MSRTNEELVRCLSETPKIRKNLIPPEKVKAIAGKMKLLAHPTRLQILKLLSEKDLCVCILSEVVGKSQPNISQHLAKLRDNNIINDYNVGKLVYYRLKDKSILKFMRF